MLQAGDIEDHFYGTSEDITISPLCHAGNFQDKIIFSKTKACGAQTIVTQHGSNLFVSKHERCSSVLNMTKGPYGPGT